MNGNAQAIHKVIPVIQDFCQAVHKVKPIMNLYEAIHKGNPL